MKAHAAARTRAWLSLALASLACACSLDTTPRAEPLDEDELAAGAAGKPWTHGPVTVADAGDDSPAEQPAPDGGSTVTGDPPAGDPSDAGPAPTDAAATDAMQDPVVPDAAPPPADSGVPPTTDDASVPTPDAATPDSGTGGLLDGIRDLLASNPRVQEAAALRRIENALMRVPTATTLADALDALEHVDCRGNARTCVAVCGWAMANCGLCSPDATCTAELRANCTQDCN